MNVKVDIDLSLWWFDAESLWNSGYIWQVFSYTASTLRKTESLVTLQVAPSNRHSQTLHEVVHGSHHEVGDIYGTTGLKIKVWIFQFLCGHRVGISCTAVKY